MMGAIARLPFNRGQQPEDLDLFQAALGPTRHDFGQPQGSPNVSNRSAPILKPVVSSALIAESVRRRVAAGPVRVAAKSERRQADRAQTARPMKVRKRP
jgi:hypothetical protein